jgi:hypothetical protein
VIRRKPRVQTPVVSHYPAPALVDDFVLLFLPPCGPHLTQLATESLESGLLVSPLHGGPSWHRPFTPTLHLHQRKSSRKTKSQSTPRCNYSSQPGEPIHRSSDAPVLTMSSVSLRIGWSSMSRKIRHFSERVLGVCHLLRLGPWASWSHV